ncbi:MAG: hypothetical protein VR64_00170 [Desulfatitalea sp. BRH_c12]|nr:MAG: hypothetical protein VR64_00170 [Desulfatitalea sp. BRH_c12]
MSFKKEYLILIAVIAVLVLYLTTRSANHEGELAQPQKVESADIKRLVVTDKKNTPLELVKKDDRWVIEPQGYPADSVKVKNMLNAASDLTLTAIVSESGALDRYGLTGDEKITVQAFSDGTPVRSFTVGKAAPTFQHTFVLLEGDPKVYHARGQLKRTFEQSADALRDKTIFDIDQAAITSLTLQKGTRTVTLVKKELPKEAAEASADKPADAENTETPAAAPVFEWQNADSGQAVDQTQVDSLLGDIAHLDADAYMDDSAKEGLGDAQWQVTFKKAEETFSLAVYPKQDDAADKLPATASSTPYAFLLDTPHVENIAKDLDALLGQEEKTQ